MILRERSPVREFFERSGAEVGDKVRIARVGERAFEFTLKRWS